MATRRIVYAVVISLGALLLLVGVPLMKPQVSILGILILLGVIVPRRMHVPGRGLRALMAKLRAPAPPPATRYEQPTARPLAPPAPRAYADPMSHEAVIRGTHPASGSPDGDHPPE